VLALLVFLIGPWIMLLFAIRSSPVSPSAVSVANLGLVPPAAPLPVIDPRAPLASLLPEPPKVRADQVYLGDDLSRVPELMLDDAAVARPGEWRVRKGRAAAAALHLNGKEEDGFLKALLRTRPDLAGVPFAMGDACRSTGSRAQAFKEAAERVRGRKASSSLPVTPHPNEDHRRLGYMAHLAVVSQVMAAEDWLGQNAMIHSLSSIPRPEATQALARLAVFSTDEAVRAAAIEALAVRREGDSTDVLVAGLRYPWPEVADNSASAIVKLKRKDLVPQIEAMLGAPDPRGPRTEVVDGREQTVAHELVRVNHLRNCMLCHAPAERGQTPQETLVAEVPIPSEPLPDTSAGYGQSGSDLLVRIDVTYLRQDFSAMQEVRDWTVGPWPHRQRFDFVVRKRVLSPGEAEDLRARLAGASPYRRAAARALRELTGRDFEGNGG
jgi:hypothetical protein